MEPSCCPAWPWYRSVIAGGKNGTGMWWICPMIRRTATVNGWNRPGMAGCPAAGTAAGATPLFIPRAAGNPSSALRPAREWSAGRMSARKTGSSTAAPCPPVPAGGGRRKWAPWPGSRSPGCRCATILTTEAGLRSAAPGRAVILARNPLRRCASGITGRMWTVPAIW